MDLRSSLNEILQVGTSKEITEVHEFAVVRVLDIDNTPTVPAAPDGFAIDDNRLLGTDNSERNNRLKSIK